jgi:hypothetical protein
VVLAVELLVVGILDLAVDLGWDAGGDALAGERGAEPVAVIPLSPSSTLARGRLENSRTAHLWSLIWPSVSSKMIGLPKPSQIAWSLEFSPPLVRPICLGTAPF